jgi:pyruvate phosphate dikinase (EC 2.7.9.1)
MNAEKYVYSFREGNAEMKNLLGGKGANLAQMVQYGLPVPQGFILTTHACLEYGKDEKFLDGIWGDVVAAMNALEKETGKTFGSGDNPLLVSVRSGSPRLHARNDGHGAQPRPQRRIGGIPGQGLQ